MWDIPLVTLSRNILSPEINLSSQITLVAIVYSMLKVTFNPPPPPPTVLPVNDLKWPYTYQNFDALYTMCIVNLSMLSVCNILLMPFHTETKAFTKF